MLKKDDLFIYLVISIFLHIAAFYFVFHMPHGKQKPIFLSVPIEVSFYSSSNQTENQSMNVFSQEKLESKEQVQVKEEHKTKESIVVKKQETSEKKSQNKLKQDTKNPEGHIGEKKGESLKSGGNNSAIETVQSQSSAKHGDKIGSPYEGLSFDTKNFKYSYYAGQIIKKIGRQWRWAESYGKLRALTYFKIRKDGMAYDIIIKESSGNSEYDRNALDTIRRAMPFPDLPEGYEDDSLGVFFEFKYSD